MTAALALKADKFTTYTLAMKANQCTTYTKTETGNLLTPKATTSYVDAQLLLNAHTATT